MISMDKKYTLNGKPHTVLTVTMPGPYSVVGHTQNGEIYLHRADGTGFYKNPLVEVSPYDDFVIDEKVMVRDHGQQKWHRSHFVGINSESGHALTSSFTRWMQVGVPPGSWIQCRRPTAEELAND